MVLVLSKNSQMYGISALYGLRHMIFVSSVDSKTQGIGSFCGFSDIWYCKSVFLIMLCVIMIMRYFGNVSLSISKH